MTLVALLASLVAVPAVAAPAVPVTLHDPAHERLPRPAGENSAERSNPGMRARRRRSSTTSARPSAPRTSCSSTPATRCRESLLSNLATDATGRASRPSRPTTRWATTSRRSATTSSTGARSILANRTAEATYPYVTANIVKNDTGNCATAGWTKPDFADSPYEVRTVGTAPNTVKVGFIGVTTTETPIITISTATAGLCFKDPAESILHYYDAMKAAGRRDRRPEPPRLRRRRLRLRHPGLRRPDAGREAQHRRQAGQPDHRRPQPHGL